MPKLICVNKIYKAQLAAALVAGEIADKVSRKRPLRIGIFIGICAIVALWLAMFAPFSNENDANAYWVATFGLFMWGSFRGFTMAPLDALFADSVATPERAKYQVRKFVATLAGASIGPLLAVLLFRNVGDTWTKNELRIVIAAGTASAVIPLVSLFWLHDKHSLDEKTSGPLLSVQEDKNDLTSQRIRILCFTADLLGGLASGMTIKFFPLFFKNMTHLSPGEVNTVTIATTFLMIFGSVSSQKLASRIGRMPVILVYKLLGIILLFVMALRKDLWEDWAIIVPIYCARTVLMNSTAPLHKSILMDHCGKEQRARWNALDSIVTFGWSGSALLGGILADKHGFGYTFLITAILQSVGFLCLVGLGTLVDDKADMRSREEAIRLATGGGQSGSSVSAESAATGNGEEEDAEEEEVVTEEYRLISDDGEA